MKLAQTTKDAHFILKRPFWEPFLGLKLFIYRAFFPYINKMTDFTRYLAVNYRPIGGIPPPGGIIPCIPRIIFIMPPFPFIFFIIFCICLNCLSRRFTA